MNKKRIALVCGGFSKENVISVRSAEVIERYIPKQQYDVYKIVIDADRWYYTTSQGQVQVIDKNDFSLPGSVHFDLAFIIIHGNPGENGLLQGYFDMLHIPYTSCNTCISAITFNKAYCNAILAHAGIRVSDSIHLIQEEPYDISTISDRIGFPCFVKPNAGGSSIGMSKVKQKEDLQAAIDKAFVEDKEVLIEKYVKGKELSCGLMRIHGQIKVFPLTQIVPKTEYFDYEAKYNGASNEITPAPVPEDLSKKIGEISTSVYRILNCFGVVRCDYIVEEQTENIYFLEINTTPGQSEQSIVPQQVRYMGWSMEKFYVELIEMSLKRK
ncbi:MAG: D-alanine--D-alanine ligase [Bacteroidales bacterium]